MQNKILSKVALNLQRNLVNNFSTNCATTRSKIDYIS